MTADVLRVGMVGYAFMGAAHAQGWRNPPRFLDLPTSPELTAVAGRNPEAVRDAAGRLGFASTETDWRALVTRGDIDPDRHLHARQQPRRDRDRRPARRQASGPLVWLFVSEPD